MTLAETWEVAVRYVDKAKIPVIVECYHFDKDVVTLENFKSDVQKSVSDPTDILVANFSVKIAHSWTTGGGHYSLIGNFDHVADLITIYDVHPKKYGRKWTVAPDKLFDAMVDKDSSSDRSRGLLRFVKTNSGTNPSKLAGLGNASRSISWNNASHYFFAKSHLERCIGPAKLAEPGRNVGDIVSVADCGIDCICDSDVHNNHVEINVDDFLQVVGDYLKVLSVSFDASELLGLTQTYISTRNFPVKASLVKFSPTQENFVDVLKSLNDYVVICAKMNDNIKVGSSVLTPPDPKTEASVFNKGIHNWNSIVSFSDKHTDCAILNTQFLVFTRLISVPLNVLLNAIMDTMKVMNKEEVEVIKLEKISN